jgi:hypothetical protein
LAASTKFLGEMRALQGDGKQVDGKNRGGIVLPAGCRPHAISQIKPPLRRMMGALIQ